MTNPPILTDEDVDRLPMSAAVECMEEALLLHAAGRLAAPGRIICELDAGKLAFTAGARTGEDAALGFRVYDFQQLGSPDRTELTVVLDGNDGSLRCLAIGPRLGPIRTGALGGAAVKHLSRADARSLALIGTGAQARTQLAAAVSVRNFESIKAFSRRADRRQVFAEEMSTRLGVSIETVESAREAVEDADVVICSTISDTPVIEAGWIKPGAHLQNVGPKFKGSCEMGEDVLDRCDHFVTDAPAQAELFGESLLLHGRPEWKQLSPLSQVVAQGGVENRRPEDITYFLSLGLAGTEVLLAERVWRLREEG